MHKENFLFDGVNEKQSQLVNDIKDMGKDKIPVEKKSFLKNPDYFLVQEKMKWKWNLRLSNQCWKKTLLQ